MILVFAYMSLLAVNFGIWFDKQKTSFDKINEFLQQRKQLFPAKKTNSINKERDDAIKQRIKNN